MVSPVVARWLMDVGGRLGGPAPGGPVGGVGAGGPEGGGGVDVEGIEEGVEDLPGGGGGA